MKGKRKCKTDKSKKFKPARKGKPSGHHKGGY